RPCSAWPCPRTRKYAPTPIPLALNLLIEPHARSTPLIPAGEHIRLVWIKYTWRSCPARETVGSDILRDGFPVQPDLLGNRPERPALLRQMADLLIAPAPVGMARGRPCGGGQGGGSLGRRGG